MLYSEIKERENRFILSLKIALPFLFIIGFAIVIVVADIDIKTLLKNNIIAFIIITFIYIYYILYQINRAFKTSVIDKTTKAFSRDYILQIIDKLIKRDKFLLILIKIDNIEDINERYGIYKTDKILLKFVKKIDQFLKDNNFKDNKIGHIVGGSFLFLMKCDEKKAHHLIKQFIHKCEIKQIDDIYLKITYSLTSNRDENSAQELLILLYDKLKMKSFNKRRNKRVDIKVSDYERSIIKLIEERNFDIRFQPILNIHTKKIETYEILIRLDLKEYGKIPQNQFISVVNRIGYELKFDLTLIEEIFKISSKYKDKKFSVNVSLYSLINNNFINKVKKLYVKYDIKKDNIIFEISVSTFLNDIKILNENIKILKILGILIAIDNFGVDNTSFQYINYVDFDIVKFDIEYSKKYNQKKSQEIVKAFITIFKELGIKTVIKFIEDEKSYNFFKELGVDCIQGFIVGKPTKELS